MAKIVIWLRLLFGWDCHLDNIAILTLPFGEDCQIAKITIWIRLPFSKIVISLRLSFGIDCHLAMTTISLEITFDFDSPLAKNCGLAKIVTWLRLSFG